MTTTTAERGLLVPEWTFGDRLRKARTTARLGQQEMADRMGERQGTYQAWETGRTTPRRLVERARLVEEITGVSASWLLGLEQPSDVQGSHTVQYVVSARHLALAA